MSIRIMLVDDHAIVVKGLSFFLSAEHDFEIVGQASDGIKAVGMLQQIQPDVVLMDLIMPKMDGIEASRRMKRLQPEVKIIVLTTSADHDHIIPAIQAGADGYLLKDIEPEEIVLAIRKVHKGESILHPEITRYVMSRIASGTSNFVNTAQGDTESPLPGSLTPRELEVLQLIAKGKSNKEIAAQLAITEKTVKTHVSNLLNKLGVSDRTQAALLAVGSQWNYN